MNSLIKYALILVLASTLLGPSIKLPFLPAPLNIYFSDIAVAILSLILLFNLNKILKQLESVKVIKVFLLLNLYFLFSLLITPISLTGFELLVSFSYLLRYFSYFSVFVAALYLKKSDHKANGQMLNFITPVTLFFVVLGWLLQPLRRAWL